MDKRSCEKAASWRPSPRSPTLAINSSFEPTSRISWALKIAHRCATESFISPATLLGMEEIFPSYRSS